MLPNKLIPLLTLQCISFLYATTIYSQISPPKILRDEEITTESALKPNHSNFSLFKKMSEEEMVIRKFKVTNTDYRNVEILQSFMEKFDKYYDSYYRNEIELNKNTTKFKDYIRQSIDKINEQEVFYCDEDADFGEYDFSHSKFAFTPFQEHEEENGNKVRYIEIFSGGWGDLSSEVLIRNLDFVNGISMSEQEAQKLLTSRTAFGGSRIERKVYLRVFYAIHNDRTTNNIGKYSYGGIYIDKCLYGEPLRVEVWGDKCRQNNLLAVYYPKKNDLSSKFHTLFDKLYMTKLENRFEGNVVTDNFKSIISWTQINDKCEREELEVHLKKIKNLQSEQDVLLIRLYTNYSYNIKPGFTFSFYNKETKVEFPLVIYETGVDKGSALLKIKITKQTLNEIVNSNCYCFRLQLTGNPKYQLSGEGVINVSKTNSRNLPIADYYLGEKEKTTLFTILKQ